MNSNTSKYLAYFTLFGFEMMMERTPYSGLSYMKESTTERELQVGSLRVMISG